MQSGWNQSKIAIIFIFSMYYSDSDIISIRKLVIKLRYSFAFLFSVLGNCEVWCKPKRECCIYNILFIFWQNIIFYMADEKLTEMIVVLCMSTKLLNKSNVMHAKWRMRNGIARTRNICMTDSDDMWHIYSKKAI